MDELQDLQVEKIGNHLDGKKITICITGGIAAIEAPKTARQLRRYGADVKVIMTPSAEKIITPLTMEWATGNPVVTEISGNAEHIELEDLVLIDPATLNTINKFAYGIADNCVTSKLASALGRGTPILIAPAMHYSLYQNPILQDNLKKLQTYENVKIIPPRLGEGKAKIAKLENIVAESVRELSESPLKGKEILITAGPTRGLIDSVRYIGNRSSGKLGVELAKEAYLRGMNVTLVYGPGVVTPPEYINTINVQTTDEMLEAVTKELSAKNYDVAMMSAAVLDYVPDKFINEKLKSDQGLEVKFKTTPKIIDQVKKISEHIFLVGFKLEYARTFDELLASAQKKMHASRSNLIVANDLSEIRGNHHPAYIVTPENGVISIKTKQEIVSKLFDTVEIRANTTHFRSIQDNAEIEPSEKLTEMIRGGEKLYEAGLVPEYKQGTYGNMSMRDKDSFYVTGRGVHKGKLSEHDFVRITKVDLDKREIHYQGRFKPSSETIVHYKMYEKYPGMQAIIHGHDKEVITHADKLGLDLTETAYPCGTLELADEVLEHLNSDYLVMKDHGFLAYSNTNLDVAISKSLKIHGEAMKYEM